MEVDEVAPLPSNVPAPPTVPDQQQAPESEGTLLTLDPDAHPSIVELKLVVRRLLLEVGMECPADAPVLDSVSTLHPDLKEALKRRMQRQPSLGSLNASGPSQQKGRLSYSTAAVQYRPLQRPQARETRPATRNSDDSWMQMARGVKVRCLLLETIVKKRHKDLAAPLTLTKRLSADGS